ncbi:MAG: hypothetical protein JWQ81_5256 [Amycolatopsis sp.]|nr:hypothetical protein [Amycolatopsis sp.]
MNYIDELYNLVHEINTKIAAAEHAVADAHSEHLTRPYQVNSVTSLSPAPAPSSPSPSMPRSCGGIPRPAWRNTSCAGSRRLNEKLSSSAKPRSRQPRRKHG